MPIDHDEILTTIATHTSEIGHVVKSVDNIEKLLDVKVVEYEKKFTERPTRKEIRVLVIKYTSMLLVVLGLMVTIFFGAVRVAAYLEAKHANSQTEQFRE